MLGKLKKESKCLTTDLERAYLKTILGDQDLDLDLLYSGSQHGWMLKDFHERCDDKEGLLTITLLKIKDGDCIGGFTKEKYSSKYPKSLKDNSAKLFNVTKQRKFSCGNNCISMIVGESEGPRFGMSDLQVIEPFNAFQSCSSMANIGSYKISFDQRGHSLLTD